MTRIQLFRYRLPLVHSLRWGGDSLSVREGLLLGQHDGTSWGEAAPLPGFSRETLSQVIAAARQRAWDRHPSLHFAYASLSFPRTGPTLPVGALLMAEPSDRDRSLAEVSALPHRCVKLKVARGESLEEDVERVQTLSRHLRDDQRLRLDANRGWNFDQAVRFASAVDTDRIEYIEEPIETPREFERLWKATNLRYALDETLREPFDLNEFPNAAALIIKPTLMGDPEQLRPMARRGIPLVFSSAFESGVGLRNIAQLASEYARDVPVGLDTYRWLDKDTLVPRLAMADGKLDLSAPWQIDHSCLEEL